MLHKACTEGGKAYGYHKLHDDLIEQGKCLRPNSVDRLTQPAEIKAKIGYKQCPGSYNGKPSAVGDNTLGGALPESLQSA